MTRTTEQLPKMRPHTDRNWHMVALLSFAVFNGTVGLFTGRTSDAVAAAFPGWLRYGWYIGLIVGGIMGVAGYLCGLTGLRPIDGERYTLSKWLDRVVLAMTVERFAMLLLTGLCVSYVLGAIMVRQELTLPAFGVAVVAGFAVANVLRARQLRLALRQMRRRLAEADGDGR